MILFRRLLGDVLRTHRQAQQLTLREVSAKAKVSLGYLSEIERGQKEASSELLASIAMALGLPLSYILGEVSNEFAIAEAIAAVEVETSLSTGEFARIPEMPQNYTGHLKRDNFASV